MVFATASYLPIGEIGIGLITVGVQIALHLPGAPTMWTVPSHDVDLVRSSVALIFILSGD